MPRLYALATSIVVGTAARAPGQTLYGSLIGNVTDASAATVPNAKLQVVNTATGFVREAATGGFSEITSAQNDERQFRLGLRISF